MARHDHSGDVNELEARALEVLLGVLICLRAGRAGELAPGLGASLSVRERAQVGRMAREARDEVLAARDGGQRSLAVEEVEEGRVGKRQCT